MLHLAFGVTMNRHAKPDPNSFVTMHAELTGRSPSSSMPLNCSFPQSSILLSHSEEIGRLEGNQGYELLKLKFPHKED